MGQAQWIQTGRSSGGKNTGGNPNRDGSGSPAPTPICTASTPAGLRVDAIKFQAVGNTTNGTLRLFLVKGATIQLIDEIPVVQVTPSATVLAWSYKYVFSPALILENGYTLAFTMHNAEVVQASLVSGGDL